MLRIISILVLVSCVVIVTTKECWIANKTLCDCRKDGKIYRIDCIRRGLTVLPVNLTNDTGIQVQLNVSHNFLKSINYPKEYKRQNVTVLDLSHNRLTSFNVSVVQDASTLKNLILKNNSLTTFSGVTLRALKNIKSRDLSSNPWNCVCWERGFLRTLSDLDKKVCCSKGTIVREFLGSCHQEAVHKPPATQAVHVDPLEFLIVAIFFGILSIIGCVHKYTCGKRYNRMYE